MVLCCRLSRFACFRESLWSFQPLRLFWWFRFGRYDRFARFVLLFQVLVHALFSMLYPEQLLISTELWFDSISLSLGFLKNNEVGFYALERCLAVFPESPYLASVSARDRGENWHESKKRNEGGEGGAYRSPEKTVSLFHWHVVLLSLQLLLKMSLCPTKGGISLQCYQRKFLMGARENKIQISQELWNCTGKILCARSFCEIGSLFSRAPIRNILWCY